jgi:hypothetical protein
VAKVLSFDDLLKVAVRSKLPAANDFIEQYTALLDELAREVADHLEVDVASADTFYNDTDDKPSTYVSLRPHNEGDPMPAVLEPFDREGEWKPAADVPDAAAPDVDPAAQWRATRPSWSGS